MLAKLGCLNCRLVPPYLYKGSLSYYIQNCHFIQLDSTPFFETINRFISQTTPDAVSDTTQSSHTNSSFLTKDKDIWQRPFLRNLVLAALVVVLVTMVIYFLFFFNFAQKEQVKLQNVKKNAVQTQEITSTPETDSLVLSIIAKKDGWARISSNKNRTFEIFLKEEVKYRWNVKEDFSIILSIADLAEVLLNDKKIQNVISNSGLLFLDINSFASKN